MPHPPLILASQSETRKKILKDSGYVFEVIASHANEDECAPLDAIGRAKLKALTVSQNYPNDWVIGADQVCHLNGTVFHKPLTVKNAIKTLQQLEGQTHALLTAACIAHDGVIIWEGLDDIKLTMRQLSLSEIKAYVTNDMPLNSCGAYCYEKTGHQLFSSVSHPTESIQGLPIKQLSHVL